MTNEYLSSDFSYKKYSLEQLDNWVNDALNCEDLTPQDIYDTVIKCVDESVEYHKKYLTKSIELLSLLKGNRPAPDLNSELQAIKEEGGFEWTPLPSNAVKSATKKDWVDFWEETYSSEETQDAICEKEPSQEEKDKCREYNLREAEYYNQRALLDAKSKYYHDYNRNDLNRSNPFQIPDYTEL